MENKKMNIVYKKAIVKIDNVLNQDAKKVKKNIDYNPIIHIPIKGV